MIKFNEHDPLIDSAKINPDPYLENFKKFGMSTNIHDYSREEMSEIVNGVYRKKKLLLTQGDYFVDLNEVISTECVLEDVRYYKRLSDKDYQNNKHKSLKAIRSFHVKHYYLITENEVNGSKKHEITKLLHKVGLIKRSTGKFPRYYSLKTYYKTLQNGNPKDLFEPIKRFINGYLFDDEYRISDFRVTGVDFNFEN